MWKVRYWHQGQTPDGTNGYRSGLSDDGEDRRIVLCSDAGNGGGPAALAPLKEPFIEKFRELIHEIS